MAVDGRYGTATRAAVVAYQRSEGLVADGWVGAATWDALEADLRRHSDRIADVDDVLLSPGKVHARAVPVLERALRLAGPDSRYGTATVTAVKAFQRSHGRAATGTVDWGTWQALRGL
ncbi:peptidoglycan-binding protein [Vallicoccus soli]|uniref:Peptidoglycan-binding protein n=1 Tax=Vallicoccus soli TaxID=2339232 RepID=A0A3A3YTS7_9ACTN|nr:peptidoglycan-binding protein [Vallicoccus soli]